MEQQPVGVILLVTKSTQRWFPYCSLFSCVCCQDGGWQSRARHARQTVRAPRFPCRRSSLDEATGFLSEAQANQQPLGPLRTCECLQGALLKRSFIIITDWYWWGAARLAGSRNQGCWFESQLLLTHDQRMIQKRIVKNMSKQQNPERIFCCFAGRFLKEGWKAKAAEWGEECDCGSAPQGDSGIACLKPSHQWACSLGS